MYLTYDEYAAMGGTLEIATFLDYEFEAESIINWYTFNRLKNDTTFSESVKRLVYRLIKLVDLSSKAQSVGQDAVTGEVTGAIASQSNDGFSTTYNVLSAKDILASKDAEIKRLVNMYLQMECNSLGQRLLYRGIYDGE